MNYYDLLGVDEDATSEVIRTAYLTKARQLHPDQHPGSSQDQTARLSEAMAAVNDAYATLKDDARRAAYDRERLRDESGGEPPRAPGPGECVLCGAGPARFLRFEHQNAWLLGATSYSIGADLCRSCGQSIGRAKQNRTLLTGWWGLLALLRNLFVVTRNTVNLLHAARLGPPAHGGDVTAPLPGPLPPGRATWRRSGFYLVATLVALATIGAALEEPSEGDDRSRETRPGSIFTSEPDAEWQTGSCIDGSTWVVPVPCSEPNDGRIVRRVSSASSCPFTAESYVEDGPDVWCIDER